MSQSQPVLTSRELSQTFQDYSNFIHLNQLNETGKNKIENSTESILLRLDEYNEHLDHVFSFFFSLLDSSKF
jgi:hypothetical protein